MRRMTYWQSTVGGVAVFVCGLMLGLGTFSGCGGGGSDNGDGNQAEKSGDNSTKSTQQGKTDNNGGRQRIGAVDNSRRRGVWEDPVTKQKYWNKHPYDVWFPDAYSVAANTAPLGTKTVAKNGGTPAGKNGGDNPPATKKTETPQASADWKSIASAKILEAEVKRIRNFLAQKMRTAGVYNGAYKKIQYEGATLAAVAQVISVHPEDDVSWKADALYVRDLGLKISEVATGLGAKNYNNTKKPYEQFVDILNRNKPAGLKEPAKDAAFFDFADRSGIMKRMQDAYNWLDKEVATEDRLKSEAEQVEHEAAILGLLAKVAADKSYDQADDPAYKGHIADIVDSTQKIKATLQTGDFMGFRKNLQTINNHCIQCHSEFKN